MAPEHRTLANGNDNGPKLLRFFWGWLVIMLLGPILLGVLVARIFSPSDWVEVIIGPFPNRTAEFCVVAEDGGEISALSWYHTKLVPFTMSPFTSGTFNGAVQHSEQDRFVTASVRWQAARRYGVLILRSDDQWRLIWLDPEDLRPPSWLRHFVGGGTATIRMPADNHVEIPSPELLKRLGYSQAKHRADLKNFH